MIKPYPFYKIIWKVLSKLDSVNDAVQGSALPIHKRHEYFVMCVQTSDALLSDDQLHYLFLSCVLVFKKRIVHLQIVISKIRTNVKTSASVGKFTMGRSNRNGCKLLEYVEQNDLKIVSKKWTWESPDGVTKNEIDHLLTNKIKCVKNIEILYNFNYSSDYRLIKGSLERFPLTRSYLKTWK